MRVVVRQGFYCTLFVSPARPLVSFGQQLRYADKCNVNNESVHRKEQFETRINKIQ